MAEIAFSGDGKYFSSISQDGRLRIWDTETNVLKQEYTPDLHLTSPPSCLQWFSLAQSGGHRKGGRKKSWSGEQETQFVALGTTSGKILIYSVAQAKIETVLEDKNTEINRNHVTAIDWHNKYGLFSCNKENVLYEWDLQNPTASNKYNINLDSKNKQANYVSAIKIIPHTLSTPAKFLVAASTQIRVWRLHGEAEVVKCLGHNAAPKALLTLTSLNNTCWLVEGSQSERLLSFWDVTITSDLIPQMNGEETTPNRKKRKKSLTAPITVHTPTYNFVLEDAPKQLDVNMKTEDGGIRLNLAAVTRSGVVHYYGHMLNGASTKPIKPSVTIQVTTAEAQPLPLQCCQLPSSGDVLLGYSQGPALLFERVTPDLHSKTQVLIRSDGKEVKKRQSTKQNETNKVRGETSASDVTYVEPMGGVSRKRVTPGAAVEVPMEERLANLTVDKTRGPAAVNQNLTKLLMQGLHSNDKRLILTVLQQNKPKVANHTVAGLPADFVALLLNQLADMAARKTSQCAAVCTWLSAVLRCHSALLLATVNGKNSSQLTHLLAIFMHRRSHLCQLLNLKGRLELTAAQREPVQQQILQQAVLQYNDTSSDEEKEVERAQSSSEHSWADSDEAPPADNDGDDDDDDEDADGD